ncbi:MAG: hypothetical protein HOV66_07970 [Streptomycetaceae bacterium]|nr:hypothetical protein [Streptomycetaceae bacterium]
MLVRRTTAAVVLGLVLTTSGCGGDNAPSRPDSGAATPPSATTPTPNSPSPPQPPGPASPLRTPPNRATAASVTAALARATHVTDLGNVTDDTPSCPSQAAPDDTTCIQLITTDTVSVYEFANETAAATWGTAMSLNNEDACQIGYLTLTWTTRNQQRTPVTTRDQLCGLTQSMVLA